MELPLRRTTMCWDHFKATKKEKKDAVALHEAEVSSSCGSCNKSIRASPMVLSM
jgi:cytochrome c556